MLSIPENADAPYLLAVSGGRDSMALLHLCHAAKLEIVVAHLDHALRQESNLDAEFVRQQCLALHIPFVSERIPVRPIAQKRGWSLEQAARNVRYEFLYRMANKYHCSTILTAHTLEDQAETVLLQLLRGTGKAVGIPKQNAKVSRPLLEVSKHQLEVYLQEHGFGWREDSSNTDPSFTRNWLRLEVLPKLLERFPNAVQSLAQHASILSAENSLLEQQAALPEWADLRMQHQAIQRRAIRQILEQAKIQPDFWHIEHLRLALSRAEVTRVSLPKDHLGVVQDGKILVFPSSYKRENTMPQELASSLGAFPDAKWRTRAAGDTMTLSGGSKKLAQIFIDRKVPREIRDQIPVLAIGSRVLVAALEPPIVEAGLPQPKDPELEAMRQALKLAKDAATRGEVPVGAVVLHRGQLIAAASNQCVAHSDMTRHAEIEALRQAAERLETAYLTECTLVVTLEPCLMCLGAALEARVRRIVFAARNPKNGALGGVQDVTRAQWNHRLEVRFGLLEREAAQLLTDFFANKRLK